MTAPEASNFCFAWALLWSCQLTWLFFLTLNSMKSKTYIRHLDRGHMVPQVLHAVFNERPSSPGISDAFPAYFVHRAFRMLPRRAFSLPLKLKSVAASFATLLEYAK
jgi:hypothetical protein